MTKSTRKKRAGGGGNGAGAAALLERYAFLAEASELLAESLDYETTLASVARLAVPRLADWCAVDMLDGTRRVRRLAVMHVDPSKVELAHELERRYPVDLAETQGLPHVLRTGRAEFYPQIPDELLEATARDAEHLRILRELGLKSGIIVPLVARGRTLGAITLVNAESGHHYTEMDLELAEDLARRAAVAVDNARLAAEVEAERRRLRDLVASVPGVVWEAWGEPDEASQRIDFVSEHVEQMLGYTVEEWLSTPNFWLTIVHPEDREHAAAEARRKFESTSGGVSEFRWLRRDGRVVHVEAHSVAVRDERGRPLGMRGVTMDVTARREAERAARESAEQFRTLADSIPQLAWMADPSGSVLWYNRRWYEYTGTTFEEMQGSGWQKVHHPAEVERVTARFHQAVAAGEPWEDTFPLRGRDGEYRRFLSRAEPIRDAAGRVVRWFGTNTDIEEQERAAEMLARLGEERERMLEEVSTPVVPVLEGVLVLPLIGSLDMARTQRAMQAALAAVTAQGARVCIIDITGARTVDSTAVANLTNLVKALKLVGAEAYVTGVGAQVARTLVGLGLDMRDLRTYRTLAQALTALLGREGGRARSI